MNPQARRRLSKRLAYHLRHGPGDAGIELDRHGWVEVDELLAGLESTGRAVTRADLRAVVEAPGKDRFELRDGRIRARYGHSVPVAPEHGTAVPPGVLYHGTVADALPAIAEEGLRPMQRRAVHLSPDAATARQVGARRGRPVVVRVDTAGMAAAGHEFRRAGRDVWLTDHVPPRYLEIPE